MPMQKAFEYKYPNVGRYDERLMKYLSPVEDFMLMAKKVKDSYTPLEFFDMLVEDTKQDLPGVQQFWKYILSGVDRSQMGSHSPRKAPLVRQKEHKVVR